MADSSDDPTSSGCAAGKYAWPEIYTCLDCPEGFYCPTIEAPPLQCIQGYYSDSGETECHICEAGKACPTPYMSQRIDCTTGYWSVAGSIMCYPVPAGQKNDNFNTRPGKSDFCAYGEISKTASAVCATVVDGTLNDDETRPS